MRPEPSEYHPYFSRYIDLVPEPDVLGAIESQSSATQRLIATLDETKAAFRYAAEKWSIREVLGHMTDTERVMGYRALAIARGETAPLPGFDEGQYASNAAYDTWRLGDIAEQYALVRRSHIVFFRNLPAEAWSRSGIANGNAVTVRALAAIIVGHERHHLGVLRERYLVG
jgi:DinB superfamily